MTTSPDTLLAAHGIPPIGGGFFGWLARFAARVAAAEARRRDAALLEAIPDYLLYDIGLTRGGAASLARQLRSGHEL